MASDEGFSQPQERQRPDLANGVNPVRGYCLAGRQKP
jgi:hypothetical protein